MKKLLWTVLVPGAILAVALGATALLFAAGGDSRPPRPDRKAPPTTVTVLDLSRGAVPYTLDLVGEVTAQRDVQIASEVSGTLSWVLPGLHAGMRVPVGTVVAKLDPTPFQAAVAQARATLADGERALALEEGQGSAAALSAALVGPIAGANEALVRRDPQLAAARATVASAEAALADATRKLALTSIRSPFDAILAEESLDPGRLVSTGATLGRWVGTARAEVEISVPTSALRHFDGESATAELRPAGSQESRVADRVSLTGVADPSTRTARVLLGVPDPYASPALVPGSFASVRLVGQPVPDVTVLPVDTLVDGGAVWSVNEDATLRRVPVTVLWHQGDDVVIAGLDGTQRVVARPSGTLLAGQAVQVRESRP